MSLIYIKISIGPKIEPSSTPHVTDALFEYTFSILIINFLFERCAALDCLFSKT